LLLRTNNNAFPTSSQETFHPTPTAEAYHITKDARFSTTSTLLSALSFLGANARLIGLQAPATIASGSSFEVTLITENYIQYVKLIYFHLQHLQRCLLSPELFAYLLLFLLMENTRLIYRSDLSTMSE
jgi:Nis1 family